MKVTPVKEKKRRGYIAKIYIAADNQGIRGLVFLTSMLLTFFATYHYFTSVKEDQLRSSLELAAWAARFQD